MKTWKSLSLHSQMTDLHAHTRRNREEIEKSKMCGCCYCLAIFPAVDIIEYVDVDASTAVCPLCGIDAVVPDAAGQVNTSVLRDLCERYFSPEHGVRASEIKQRLKLR